jgi:hypothetical protein
MKNVRPELIQKYVVEINDTVYPPKQIIDVCVGFSRASFTTTSAQSGQTGQQIWAAAADDCAPTAVA